LVAGEFDPALPGVGANGAAVMLPERSRQMYSVYAGGLRERCERVRLPKLVVDSLSYAL